MRYLRIVRRLAVPVLLLSFVLLALATPQAVFAQEGGSGVQTSGDLMGIEVAPPGTPASKSNLPSLADAAGQGQVIAAQTPVCIVAQNCIGFPDADDASGKFVNVTRGLSSLGDTGAAQQIFNISLAIPASLTVFELSIFDGDLGGYWDRWNLPTATLDQMVFKLYKDPAVAGSTAPADLLYTWPAGSMIDDNWCTLNPDYGIAGEQVCEFGVTLPNVAAAYNATRNAHFYHLVADWASTGRTNEQNNFKVAVQGQPFLRAGSTIGFEGFSFRWQEGVYPPNPPLSSFDGNFLFKFFVPEAPADIKLFDGDADLRADTDDPNSPSAPPPFWPASDAFPPFQTSPDTAAEGSRTGNPADDSDLLLINPPGFPLAVPPAVRYSVTAPGGLWTVNNLDPSGDKEWEVFKIGLAGCDGSGVVDPLARCDASVSSLPSGLYTWVFTGQDQLNTTFLHSEYEVYPGLGSLGNTVWKDLNNDGHWDQATEPGINGVKVTLYTVENGVETKYGETVTAKVNGLDGQYKFTDLPIGKQYVVKIDPSNFLPGGPLAGLAQTKTFDEGQQPGDGYNRPLPWTVNLATNIYYVKADFGFNACIPCSEGVEQMTLKVDWRTSTGDMNERIRVRADGINGAVLYDSAPNYPTTLVPMPVGTQFSFAVPKGVAKVVVTVLGKNHPYEYVKATFRADCELKKDTIDGNTYIKFKVVDIKVPLAPICKPVCVDCIDGIEKMTLKLTYRTSTGDRNEQIRVRVGGLGGQVLYDTLTDGNTSDPGLPVNAEFSFGIPKNVAKVVVTVQGKSHPSEYVKATFYPDCYMQVGVEDGNSYIKFKVVAVVRPVAPICEGSTAGRVLYLSSDTDGSVGFPFKDEDILSYNNGAWSMYLDLSTKAVYVDVDAFAILANGKFALSFNAAATIPGIGAVDDSDIVSYDPATGTFSMLFDGSDVGLTTDDEDIDALTVLKDGSLVISTVGAVSVPTNISLVDEDLLQFKASSLGSNTAGTWSFYFDGSDVGLGTDSEDIDGLWIDGDTGDIYLSTLGLFSVNGVTGDASDVFICKAPTIGASSACKSFSLYFDGSVNGFAGENTDSLHVTMPVMGAATSWLRTLDEVIVEDPAQAEEDNSAADEVAPEGDFGINEVAPEGDFGNNTLYLPLIAQ